MLIEHNVTSKTIFVVEDDAWDEQWHPGLIVARKGESSKVTGIIVACNKAKTKFSVMWSDRRNKFFLSVEDLMKMKITFQGSERYQSVWAHVGSMIHDNLSKEMCKAGDAMNSLTRTFEVFKNRVQNDDDDVDFDL